MQPDKVFKRYDVRGKYPEELDEEFVERMGKSLGKFALGEGHQKLVVSRDNKESSESLKDSLIDGVVSTGVDVMDVGIGPTDFAAFHGSQEGALSVQVTSSHMPLDFNGLKFIYPEGNGFLNEDLDRLERFFHQDNFTEGKGDVKFAENPKEKYIEALVEFIQNKGEIFDRKIVVDSLGGVTSDLLPKALKKLGFKVLDISEEKEGIYRDPPNPKPELLDEMEERVKDTEAYMGIATDLDGDRVQIYFDGEWISGDDLFCVFAQLFEGEVVASVDTSKNLEEFSEKVYYTRVGDPFVVDKMLEEDAVLSAEPNGHYCFPEFVNYNSGTLAGILAASVDFKDLYENVPQKFLEKRNIEYGSIDARDRHMEKFHNKANSDLNIDSTIDGVKFSYKGASILVRPSGSSPKIRVKSEGSTEEEARKGLKKAMSVLGKD